MVFTAATRPLAGIPHATPISGNGMRVFIALRQLNLLKPDDVVYRMVIKSLVKRKRRIQEIVLLDAGPKNAEEDIKRFQYLFTLMAYHPLTASCCTALYCAALCSAVLRYSRSEIQKDHATITGMICDFLPTQAGSRGGSYGQRLDVTTTAFISDEGRWSPALCPNTQRSES